MRYQAGDVLDGYVLETECGSGAYGSVFLAENRTLGQKCALKILYKNGQQYEKELEGLKTYQQKCRHANLMRVDHVGENDECIFYTMDAADNLHPGQTYVADTLGNRLRERTRLSPEELLPMLRDLLDGLDTLHNAGILHRDIKPDNILWVNGRAMLGDIGLISNKTEASMAGTPGFISPRVWTRRAFTPQDDLYALAMVMYCALNGTQPEDYPIPGSMPLTDSVQQINRVYNEVLKKDSAVRTVKDFQALLQQKSERRHIMRNVLFFIIGIVIISGAVWIFAARNKKTEPVDAPRPMRPAAVQQTTPAPQPKPEPPPKPVEEPAPVPDICILPGTIYELHLPPLPREGTSPQILMNDGARVQILFKQKILQIQRQYAEVPRRIAADIPRIGQLYEAVECLWSAMHDCKRTFAFTPLTETAYRVRTLRSPMPREEYDKIHQEEYKSVLETLKRYSPKEQAQFLYFAASREEQYLGSVLFREALPDTEANRKILERDYRAWVATHAWMLKKREELLAFY